MIHHQTSQSPSHPVPDHRTTDGPGHHEADLGPGTPRNSATVQHECARPTAHTAADRRLELLGTTHPERDRQHRWSIKQTARSGPCVAEQPGSLDLPWCAYAAGTRGSWLCAGCSAGRCAWTRQAPGRFMSPPRWRTGTSLSNFASGAPGTTRPRINPALAIGVRAPNREPSRTAVQRYAPPSRGVKRASPLRPQRAQTH